MAWEDREFTCSTCDGAGTVRERKSDPRSPEVTCPECNGTGTVK